VKGRIQEFAILIMVFAMALFALDCNKKKEPVAPASPLPTTAEVTGWERSAEPRSYTAANLWEYIDGDAERYVKAGVKGAVTAEYKFQNKIEAVADVYTMGDANGAKTLFDAEPAGDSKPVAIGEAARQFKQSIVFRKGPSLVRVVAYQDSPDVPQAVLDLAKGIERKLGN
jgi:hypothetical protein